MSKEVKVSIIIPIYKSKAFLPFLFDCLLKQTLSSIEIIAVNDGSPDDSGLTCEEYAAVDKRVKVIHKQNGGAASAVQRGLDESVGEYVMFLDADDWIDHETCETAYSVAIKENADLIFWSFVKEFPDKQLIAKSIFKSDMIFDTMNIGWLKRRIFGLIDNELAIPYASDAINMV
ncbi:MAG: glycosyltransferase, partial [Cyclobacteriaceae bacterium]|nr:glycosyltransferase [Cyclobacteriaceae bacterium]